MKARSWQATAPSWADADIRPGQSVELLKELHILTRDGRLNQDSRRKLKQVYHLYQFIEKLLLELESETQSAAGPDVCISPGRFRGLQRPCFH